MAARKKLIDFEQLEKLLHLQCTELECASYFGISKNTLKARIKESGHEGFQQYADIHRAPGKISLRRHQWRNAEKGNVIMQIWLGKQWLAQTDKVESRTEVTAYAGAGLAMQQTKAVKVWVKQIRDRVRAPRN
jgi:hypothetical protein